MAAPLCATRDDLALCEAVIQRCCPSREQVRVIDRHDAVVGPPGSALTIEVRGEFGAMLTLSDDHRKGLDAATRARQ